MRRAIWTIALVIVAIAATVTAPSRASAADPCFEHECHNPYDCWVIGCPNGCNPVGTRNPSGGSGLRGCGGRRSRS